MTGSLFAPAGLAALRCLASRKSLLSFDLDGTLAAMVARPSDARVSRITAARLQALAERWPVAVITGRAVADAQHRLGFAPRYLVGNHGAERAGLAHGARPDGALDPCRVQMRRWAGAFEARRVETEDKGASLAWHYRAATDAASVRGWLDGLLSTFGGSITVSHGHAVVNISPVGAPDKGDALVDLMRDCGVSCALIVGDDANDEPAFARATLQCVSVRIGPAGTTTGARFALAAQSQINPLLSFLLSLPG